MPKNDVYDFWRRIGNMLTDSRLGNFSAGLEDIGKIVPKRPDSGVTG
jgi:hypothetical protein